MSNNKGKSIRQDTQEYTEIDEIQEQRAVIRRLTKIIKRLRRELTKQRDVEEDYEALINEIPVDRVPSPIDPSCPEPACKGPLRRMDFPKFFLDVCQSCRYRKRTQK